MIIDYDRSRPLGRIRVYKSLDTFALDLPVRSIRDITHTSIAALGAVSLECVIAVGALHERGRFSLLIVSVAAVVMLMTICFGIYAAADWWKRRQTLLIRPGGITLIDVSKFVMAQETIEWWQIEKLTVTKRPLLGDDEDAADVGIRISFVDGANSR